MAGKGRTEKDITEGVKTKEYTAAEHVQTHTKRDRRTTDQGQKAEAQLDASPEFSPVDLPTASVQGSGLATELPHVRCCT